MKDKNLQPDIQKTALRLPKKLHAKIHEAAQVNGRSMNAEIVARLHASFRDNVGLGVPTDLEAEINSLLRTITTYETLQLRLEREGKSQEDAFVRYAIDKQKNAIQRLSYLDDLYSKLHNSDSENADDVDYNH